MTKIETVSTAATRTSSLEKSRRPTWKAVSACRSPSPTRDPRRTRSSGRCATTTPRPGPARTIVPMKAQDGRSRAESVGGGSAVFSAGIDSPVRTASSHSSAFASSRRRSAGTTSPTSSCDDVAGHEVGHVDDGWWPRRATTSAGGGCCACSAATALLGPVLVHEAQPDAERDDRGDDHRAGRVAGQPGHQGRAEQQQQQGVAQLAHQDVQGGGPPMRDQVRAEAGQALTRLRAGQPARGGPEGVEDLVGRLGAC